MTTVLQPARSRISWLLIALLLLGAFLRWVELKPMSNLLYFDEAYNGVDAVSLLQQPRLTPFFEDNNGRESAWMYLLAAFVGVFDAQPLALRLAVSMVGVLTLAAVYVLGKEVLNKRAALWGVGALAVMFWPVHLSQIALRAVLMVLVGVLASAALLRAYRQEALRWWSGGGLLLGLLAYTYFAARLWIAYWVIILIGWIIFNHSARRGSVLALGCAALVTLPLIIYTLQNPVAALGRVNEVSTPGLAQILQNAAAWSRAFFAQGDLKFLLNVAGRPIFDPMLGAVFIAGILALPWGVRRRWHMMWLAGLAVVLVAPSLLSDDAPHFLRAIGLLIPLGLVCGCGLWIIERATQRVTRRGAVLVPIGLVFISGAITFHDQRERWLTQSDVAQFLPYDTALLTEIKYDTSVDLPLYLPYTPYLPLIDPRTDFRKAYLAPRPVAIFNPTECFIATNRSALYAVTQSDAADYRGQLEQWMTVAVDREVNTGALFEVPYTVLRAEPQADLLAPQVPQVEFDRALRVEAAAPLPPQIRSGAALPIALKLRALRPLDRPYSIFVHLYRPAASGALELVSQADSTLCPSYPTPFWQSYEIALLSLALPIPADLPAGDYLVGLGVYDTETLARLPVTAPVGTRPDDALWQTLKVEP